MLYSDYVDYISLNYSGRIYDTEWTELTSNKQEWVATGTPDWADITSFEINHTGASTAMNNLPPIVAFATCDVVRLTMNCVLT